MTDMYYEKDLKIGMAVLYLPGMRDDVVGTINIITQISDGNVFTRRWNKDYLRHERGNFDLPIEKYKIKIIL